MPFLLAAAAAPAQQAASSKQATLITSSSGSGGGGGGGGGGGTHQVPQTATTKECPPHAVLVSIFVCCTSLARRGKQECGWLVHGDSEPTVLPALKPVAVEQGVL